MRDHVIPCDYDQGHLGAHRFATSLVQVRWNGEESPPEILAVMMGNRSA